MNCTNLARVLMLLWAAFWTYLILGNFVSEVQNPSGESGKGYLIMSAALLGVILLTWLTWKRQHLAKYFLIGLGLVAIIGYMLLLAPNFTLFNKTLTALLLGLPLLLTGIFLPKK